MKKMVLVLAVAVFLMSGVASFVASPNFEAQKPISTPKAVETCNNESGTGTDGRGFCNISFCLESGIRCVNTGGHCPGNCTYQQQADASCTTFGGFPNCYAGCF